MLGTEFELYRIILMVDIGRQFKAPGGGGFTGWCENFKVLVKHVREERSGGGR